MDVSAMSVVAEYVRHTRPGVLSDGIVISTIINMGCTSYSVDYRLRKTTLHFNDGSTYQSPHELPEVNIQLHCDEMKLEHAMSIAHDSDIYYSQFLRLTIKAGAIGYEVWLVDGVINMFGIGGYVITKRFKTAKDYLNL